MYDKTFLEKKQNLKFIKDLWDGGGREEGWNAK